MHPGLSLAQLTKLHLAPRWQLLSAAEKKPFKEAASTDAKRWEAERESAAPKKEALSAIQERVENVNAPLSGGGLYVAANWDTRNTSLSHEEAETQLLQKWIDLDSQAQAQWKSKAMANQKAFVLQVAKPRKSTKKRRKWTKEH